MKLLLPVLALLASPAAAEPLIVDNGRLFVAARINGVGTEALLDSGAEASLIDPALATAAGLGAGKVIEIKGSGGAQKAAIVSGVTIEALGQRLEKLDVVVLGLGDLSARLIKRPTSAIVGRELFDSARIEVDITGGQVRTVDRSATPPGTRLPLTTQHGIEAVPVTVAGVAAKAELDFGNGSSVMVSKAFSDRLGLKPTGIAKGGGIGGEVTRTTVVLPSLTVGPTTFRDVPAQIDETPQAGEVNIGTSILRNFLVTTDFKDRAVWLVPARTSR